MRVFIFILLFVMADRQVLMSQVPAMAEIDTVAHDSFQVKVLRYHLNGRTASGQLTRKIKEPFVAISRDLLDVYPLGSYLRLSNCVWAGTYRVLDKMGKRHTKTIDVFTRKKKRGVTFCTCQRASSP